MLAKVGERFLVERNLPKGGMVLLDPVPAGKIYQDIVPEREVSGGSAANTIAGMASLGLACAFIGKVHDDELGQQVLTFLPSRLTKDLLPDAVLCWLRLMPNARCLHIWGHQPI